MALIKRVDATLLLVLLLITILFAFGEGGRASRADVEAKGNIPNGTIWKQDMVYEEVWNMLPAGDDLGTHCMSHNDDVGLKSVASGVALTWSFRPNFFLQTVFRCSLGSKYGVVGFDAYDSSRDSVRCATNCTWNVKDDGVYGIHQYSKIPDLFFPWVS